MNLDRPKKGIEGVPGHAIFIIDDHVVLREGLQRLIECEPDLFVSGFAENAKQASQRIAENVPSLVLVDISLPGPNGLELIKGLRARFPELRMLALSMHDESLYAERALRAGARGYVMKSASSRELIAAIRKVLAGETYFSPRLSAQLMQTMVQGNTAQPDSLALLSDRELEIVQLIGSGLSTSEIATQLGISTKTVESHRGNIRVKLSLKSGAELARFSIAHAPAGK